MKVSDAFPSKYLKAEDIGKRRVVVTIDRVDMEDFDDGKKLIIFFQGKQKGMVLNKTNASNIAYLYGDETNGWPGKNVELFTMLVEFQGRQVPALRISPPPGETMESEPLPDGRPTLNAPPAQMPDDEIGF